MYLSTTFRGFNKWSYSRVFHPHRVFLPWQTVRGSVELWRTRRIGRTVGSVEKDPKKDRKWRCNDHRQCIAALTWAGRRTGRQFWNRLASDNVSRIQLLSEHHCNTQMALVVSRVLLWMNNRCKYQPQIIVNVMFQGLGFDRNPVDVFVQTFQQVPQEFLWILLIVAHEARGEFLNLQRAKQSCHDFRSAASWNVNAPESLERSDWLHPTGIHHPLVSTARTWQWRKL